ncbi:MAG: class II fructose-bisphosphate aldolase [Anaerolineae bacterium]
MTLHRPENLLTLRELLPPAEAAGYAVGSFSPRYKSMIRHVLLAAEQTRSPLIVQISSNELRWFETTPAEFAEEFFRCLGEERITVPVALHLDHTKDPDLIAEAIAVGFTSVMIDRSELPLASNMALTKEVVEYAHSRGVSVEAELGRIFAADQIETAEDEELLTVPEEAAFFAAGTGVDALAVSVGTAHGVYMVRRPWIDVARLAAIRRLTPVHLVLHGGSGVPAEMIASAIRVPGGGISKVNIATDLEQALLRALNRDRRLSNAELESLPPEASRQAGAAVEAVVKEKIERFLGSAGRGKPLAAEEKSKE